MFFIFLNILLLVFVIINYMIFLGFCFLKYIVFFFKVLFFKLYLFLEVVFFKVRYFILNSIYYISKGFILIWVLVFFFFARLFIYIKRFVF